ncbi:MULTISPECIES: tetratricopeptide repeat protein [unclassified Nocardiopsis]|uniref:tetratricopeptide repeat protein n=1 Tax=unclassified Nocardiopsis TaxID=2649073 RepID=UPI0013580828|nr:MULTISPECIES: tetratricopeptide repeat protein [unclassified Nocardiopsis]
MAIVSPATNGSTPPRGWRPLRTGLIAGLAVVVGLSTALQEVPGLLPGNDSLVVLVLAVVGSGLAATSQVLIDHLSRPPRPEEKPALRRRLPPPVDHFTGHAELMGELLDLFSRFPRRRAGRLRGPARWRGGKGGAGGPLAIAITGEGGTGKSQLVAQVVDQVQDRFPDGKLEFELHGGGHPASAHARSAGRSRSEGYEGTGPLTEEPRRPRPPEDVLAQMITEVGGRPPENASLDELVGLWRTATERRRLLIVLDNAKDHAQVEPLLPSGPGCAVLITSRDGFHDAARPMLCRHLDPLSPEEGLELVNRLVRDSPRPLSAADRAALPDLVEACHRFPLALCLVSSQITRQRGPGAADLLRHMRDPALRLTVPGPHAIATSFAFSLQQCAPRERLLLSRLAGAGLATFTAWSAAALLGIPEDEAKPLLARMSHRYLVTYLYEAAGFDRYQLHDHVRDTLLAAGPRVLGVPEEERPDWSREELERAVERLLRAYDRLAEAAARRAAPHEWSFGASPPGRDDGHGGADADGPDPVGPSDPMAWLESERRGLEACFRWTRPRGGAEDDPPHGDTGEQERRRERFIGYGWRLRRAFAVLCRSGGRHWEAMRLATRQTSELALEMGDPLAYAIAQIDRAEVASGYGDLHTGSERALIALHVLEGLESADPRWRARAHRAAGANLYRRGDLDDGRVEIEQAVRIFTEHDDRWWQVRALCNLAEVDRFQGHLDRAHELLTRARSLLVGSQDSVGQWARVQLQMGELLRLRGYALNAWFVLDDERERLSGTPNGEWYHARYLRSLGRLSTNELNQGAWDCELLLSPARERERRRLTAQDPEWPRKQRERVAALFVDADRVDAERYAERCAETGPPRGPLRRRERLRDTWQTDDQIARLRRAERAFVEIGDEWGRWRTCLVLGQALMAVHRDRGKDEMLRAAEGFEELGDRWWHARAHRLAAESLQQADRPHEAEELAKTAVEGYRGLHHRSGQLRAMRLLAEILTGTNPLEAWRTLQEARELAREGVRLGTVPESLLQQIEDMLRVA